MKFIGRHPAEIVLGLFIITFMLSSCKKSEYARLVDREMKAGRQDSIFLGMYFGMKRQDFFDHCMELNRQHIATSGIRGGLSVLYKIEDPAGTIQMNFYPEFWKDQIYEMRVLFNYENWTPWSQNTHQDSLRNRVGRLFNKWYGSDFIKVERSPGDTALVKVTGNRRIVIFKEGESDVRAIFTNLIDENETKK